MAVSGQMSDLSEATIKACLERNPGQRFGLLDKLTLPGADETPLRESSVLLPLCREAGEWRLLYIRRTETVGNHKGQVAFPGGAAEPGDLSPQATALRETWEETGLPPEKIRVLGTMPPLVTHTRFRITPVVGVIPWPAELHLSGAEVSHAFTIPLAWLAEPENYFLSEFTSLPDRKTRSVIYFRTYAHEVLWGVSAIITLSFLAILGLID